LDPFLTNSSARDLPRPLAAPVTMTTFSAE
jgi:hypothetical protein